MIRFKENRDTASRIRGHGILFVIGGAIGGGAATYMLSEHIWTSLLVGVVLLAIPLGIICFIISYHPPSSEDQSENIDRHSVPERKM